MSRDIYLSNERYCEALKRFLSDIKAGLELETVNSNEIGNKYFSCSWGLCSDKPKQWPDAQDHFLGDGRGPLAILYRKNEHLCPFDTRKPTDDLFNGCFYTCRVFQSEDTPTREEAIQRYEKVIEEL